MSTDQTRSEPSPASPQPLSPGIVWQGHGGRELELLGYVVSERDNPQHLIAYAPLSAVGETERALEAAEALRDCTAIAYNPEAAGAAGRVIDLRAYGKPDSSKRMPLDLYEWSLAPVGSTADDALNNDTFQCWPYCRFRVADMLANAAAPGPAPVDPAPLPSPLSAGEREAPPRPAKRESCTWWELAGNLRVEPATHPNDAKPCGYAVMAGSGLAAGVVAYVPGLGPDVDVLAGAKELAERIAEYPSVLDAKLDRTVSDERYNELPSADVFAASTDSSSMAYGDLLNDVEEFTTRARAHPDLKSLAVAARAIAAYRDYDNDPPMQLLRDVRGVIWRMSDEQRRRVLNGWRFPDDAARDTRDRVEKRICKLPMLQGLHLHASAKGDFSAAAQQWMEDSTQTLQLKCGSGQPRPMRWLPWRRFAT
jgi:hypothetical protein